MSFFSVCELSGKLLSANLGDDETLGLALYVEAILRLVKRPPKLVAKGPAALNNVVPASVAERLYDTFAVKGQL